VKKRYTEADVFARVDETMQLAIKNGTCAIRLFADVDADSGLNAVKALLAIRQKYASLMTVQVVAFPQDGVLGEGTHQLMQQALEAGADVVGGIPWIEPEASLQQRHIEMCFALAKTFNRDLHFVCDDVADPNVRSLAEVARQTIAHN
jgi:cytosine deaminase